MSIAPVAVLGSNQFKTLGPQLHIDVLEACPVGSVIAVWIAFDNLDTATGDTARFVVSDAVGNTYTRVRERTQSVGVLGDGVLAALFIANVTTELPLNGRITVSAGLDVTAHAISAYKFSKGAGTTLAVQATAVLEADTGQPGAITISGLPSREYLFLHLCALETGTTGIVYTQQAGYTDIQAQGTTGGSSNTNQSIRGGFRVATATSETVDVTLGSGSGHVQILAALYEVSGGGSALTLDLSDVVPLLDSTSSVQDVALGLDDTVALADQAALAAGLGIDLGDGVALTDDLTLVTDLALSLSDSVFLFDGFDAQLEAPCMPDAVCGTHLCGEAICGTWWACPNPAGLQLGGHLPDEIFVGQPPVPSAGLILGTETPGLFIEGEVNPPDAGLILGARVPMVRINSTLSPAAAGLYLGTTFPARVTQEWMTQAICSDLDLVAAGDSSLVLVGAPETTIALDEQECR